MFITACNWVSQAFVQKRNKRKHTHPTMTLPCSQCALSLSPRTGLAGDLGHCYPAKSSAPTHHFPISLGTNAPLPISLSHTHHPLLRHTISTPSLSSGTIPFKVIPASSSSTRVSLGLGTRGSSLSDLGSSILRTTLRLLGCSPTTLPPPVTVTPWPCRCWCIAPSWPAGGAAAAALCWAPLAPAPRFAVMARGLRGSA